MQGNVVLPFNFVSEVILVARIRRIPGVELLVGVPERDRPDGRVQLGAARIAPVLVPEAAAGDRIDRRGPGRGGFFVGAHEPISGVKGGRWGGGRAPGPKNAPGRRARRGAV